MLLTKTSVLEIPSLKNKTKQKPSLATAARDTILGCADSMSPNCNSLFRINAVSFDLGCQSLVHGGNKSEGQRSQEDCSSSRKEGLADTLDPTEMTKIDIIWRP